MRRAAHAILALCAAAAPAAAGGLYVGDNGAQGMQRAGAFAAKADDPTAVYYNPAGMAKATGPMLYLGLNLIDLELSYQRTGEYQEQFLIFEDQPGYVGDRYPRVAHDGAAQPIPFVAAVVPYGAWSVGAGVFAPHGHGGRSFPEQIAGGDGALAPAPQRYDIVGQTGVVVMPSLAIAYQANPYLRLGLRASWVYGRFATTKYAQGLPNGQEQPGLDTRAEIDVRDPVTLGWGAGVHIARAGYELAATYTAALHMHATGTARFELGDQLSEPVPGVVIAVVPVADAQARCAPGGTAERLRACAEISFPQHATVAARHAWRRGGRELADVELDLRWEDWSGANGYALTIDGATNVLGTPLADTVIDQGLRDVYSIRVAGARALELGGRRFELRGGLAYDTAATPLSWTTLAVDGGSRTTWAAGVGVELGRWQLDVGAAAVLSPVRTVHDQPLADPTDPGQRVQPDVTAPLAGPVPPYHPYNGGVYRSRYLVASVGLTARL